MLKITTAHNLIPHCYQDAIQNSLAVFTLLNRKQNVSCKMHLSECRGVDLRMIAIEMRKLFMQAMRCFKTLVEYKF